MKKIMKKLIVFTLLLAVATMAATMAEGGVTAQAKKMNSSAAAKKAALKKVPSATIKEIDTDMENGKLVYDVELYKKNKEYTLKYRASDGKLLEYGWEIVNLAVTSPSRKNLSKTTIKKKAKKLVKKAKITSVRLKHDDGMAQYKVKLTKGNKKYELVYNSKTGKLLEYEWEITTKKSTTQTKYIGVTKAKSIAQKKAPKATIVKVEFEKDDGIPVYEISMIEGIYEYDVKIHAKTGKILEFEKEIDD